MCGVGGHLKCGHPRSVNPGLYTVCGLFFNQSIYIGNPTFNVAVILHSLEVGLLADILLN